ncbi:MAG: alpha/beta hydrolase [Sedimentisphaerales bacterium]
MIRYAIVTMALITVTANLCYAGVEKQDDAIILKIWSKSTLGEGAGAQTETLEPDRSDDVIRVSNITDPTIMVYKPKQVEVKTPAVVICPGGGYSYLAINKEGTEVANWFTSIGVTAIVLKYRAPNQRENAFKDIQRAIRVVRSNADEWQIETNRIGVIGFSAGAHLCERVSGEFDNRSYKPVDEKDSLSCRPDFTILLYPAYLYDGRSGLREDVKLSSKNPPTFIVQTQDDGIGVENSVYYYLALKKVGVSSELHVFPTGGHGYGIRPSKDAVSHWPELCRQWLRQIGVLRE